MTFTLTLPAYPYPQSLAASLSLLVLSEYTAYYFGSAIFKTIASLSFFLGGLRQGSAVYQVPTTSLASLLDYQAFCNDERYRFTVFMIFGLGFSVLGDVFLIPSRKHYYAFLAHKTTTATTTTIPGTPKSKSSKNTSKKPRHSSSSSAAAAAEPGPGDTIPFKLGMLFFALAHICYIGGFASNPTRTPFNWTSGVLAIILNLAGSFWLGIFGSGSNAPSSKSYLAIPSDMGPLVKGYSIIIATMVATATATDSGSKQKMLGAWLFMISDMFVAVDTFGSNKEQVIARSNGKSRPNWAFRSVGLIIYFGANLILAGSI